MSSGKTFEQSWIYPNELKQQLGAARYDIRPLPETFKSGRPKWECLIFDRAEKLLSRRLAMELVSKRTGKPYFVVERDEPTRLQRAPRPASTTQSYTLDDVFDDELVPPPLPLRRETTSDYHSRVQDQ